MRDHTAGHPQAEMHRYIRLCTCSRCDEETLCVCVPGRLFVVCGECLTYTPIRLASLTDSHDLAPNVEYGTTGDTLYPTPFVVVDGESFNAEAWLCCIHSMLEMSERIQTFLSATTEVLRNRQQTLHRIQTMEMPFEIQERWLFWLNTAAYDAQQEIYASNNVCCLHCQRIITHSDCGDLVAHHGLLRENLSIDELYAVLDIIFRPERSGGDPDLRTMNKDMLYGLVDEMRDVVTVTKKREPGRGYSPRQAILILRSLSEQGFLYDNRCLCGMLHLDSDSLVAIQPDVPVIPVMQCTTNIYPIPEWVCGCGQRRSLLEHFRCPKCLQTTLKASRLMIPAWR
tara:strand:+ start:3357 stop:4379 length:1023 start_codon:yes stop_codon:yes gene_type:complete